MNDQREPPQTPQEEARDRRATNIFLAVAGVVIVGVGIWLESHATRIAALVLVAVTTFKCFLYDLASLGGLYRVASFVGLAISLALVSLALQKFVLARPKSPA